MITITNMRSLLAILLVAVVGSVVADVEVDEVTIPVTMPRAQAELCRGGDCFLLTPEEVRALYEFGTRQCGRSI